MRAPRRRRPRRRVIQAPPEVDLRSVADRVTYVGSPEHKDFPSFAGAPRLRQRDASPCPRSIRDPEVVCEWLRDAIRRGATAAPWEGGYPRYVWYKHGETVFEGRLVNRGNGEYKGFPLRRSEWPEGIEALYAKT